MRNSNASDYGASYWVVEVDTTVSADGRLFVWADAMKVNDNGDLVFTNHYGTEGQHKFVGLLIASGQWISAYAASVYDNEPAVVEKRKSPIEPNNAPTRHQEEKKERSVSGDFVC